MRPMNDIKAFNSMFNEYHNHFIRFAFGYVKDEEVAQDFVSEAFTIYWEKKSELLPDTIPQAYILTIIKNSCLNYLQHQKIRLKVNNEMMEHADWVLQTKISTLEACDPEFLFSDEIQEIVNKTLKKLPPKTQHIFSLSRELGLTYKEIAELTNLSIKSVEFHISKSLTSLRLSLKDFLTLIALFSLF